MKHKIIDKSISNKNSQDDKPRKKTIHINTSYVVKLMAGYMYR